jgi:hypothetical protein
MFALELLPKEHSPRCLTGISYSGISFNISGYMTFTSLAEIEEFKKKWTKHFFNLDKLLIIEVADKLA